MNNKFLAMASMYAAMGSMIPDMEIKYNTPSVYTKTQLTNKQKKARAKSKRAKKNK